MKGHFLEVFFVSRKEKGENRYYLRLHTPFSLQDEECNVRHQRKETIEGNRCIGSDVKLIYEYLRNERSSLSLSAKYIVLDVIPASSFHRGISRTRVGIQVNWSDCLIVTVMKSIVLLRGNTPSPSTVTILICGILGASASYFHYVK